MEFFNFHVSFCQHSLIKNDPFQTFSFADCDENPSERVVQFYRLMYCLFIQKDSQHSITVQQCFADRVESLGIVC